MLPRNTMELQYYLNFDGNSPFEDWFIDLHVQAAAKVTTVLVRMEKGNVSNVKSVGAGISEIKID